MTTIDMKHITKIEGHASLNLKIREGKVEKCELKAVEGSRYFEGLLVGKHFNEASWVSSRICGICSCAHVISSVSAIENALNIKVSRQTTLLRTFFTLAERIRSHATHLYFLALPDYVGFESALEMAPKYKNEVLRALRLMKVGNDMIVLAQGRDLHPISTTPGGFLKWPKQEELLAIKKRVLDVMEDAEKTVELFDGLTYPDYMFNTSFFSLSHPKEYAMLEGGIKTEEKHYAQENYTEFMKEFHDADNSSNFVVKEGKSYMVGALSRLNNNSALLRPRAAYLMRKLKTKFPSKNPYHINVAQAIELVHALEEAAAIVDELDIRDEKPVSFKLKVGRGIAAIEVPRGTLWHEYKLDDQGVITYANIVTPTAQNLRNMQDALQGYIPSLLNKKEDEIVLGVEKLIRSYDPCFSCATHFLKVKWE